MTEHELHLQQLSEASDRLDRRPDDADAAREFCIARDLVADDRMIFDFLSTVLLDGLSADLDRSARRAACL